MAEFEIALNILEYREKTNFSLLVFQLEVWRK